MTETMWREARFVLKDSREIDYQVPARLPKRILMWIGMGFQRDERVFRLSEESKLLDTVEYHEVEE